MTADSRCDGCTGCHLRCTDGIKISEYEFEQIVEALRAADRRHARKVLGQDKARPWFEELTYTACLFIDLETRLCLVYPARPLICRLFGRVPHLPCPEGAVPADYDPSALLAAYTAQPLQTFQAWMIERGWFNFDELFGEADVVERVEV